MFKTLRISFSLKNTYRVNTILYSLKQIPLIRKILPSTLYNVRGLKIFANVIAILWEIMTFFVTKLTYIGTMIYIVADLYEGSATDAVFLHIFLFLTIIGAFLNTYIFETGKDKYYAIVLMRMNPKHYAITNYAYTLFKAFVGTLAFGLLFGITAGLSIWQCIILPFFVVGIKLAYTSLIMLRYDKAGKVPSQNKVDLTRWIIALVLLFAAYLLPLAKFTVPAFVSSMIMLPFILLGILGIFVIARFKEYYSVYKQLLSELAIQMDNTATKVVADQHKNFISNEGNYTSNKTGYEYLNELFIKRHRKILWKSSKVISLVSFGLILAAFIAILIFPESKLEVNELLLVFLPYFVFIMYAINRGTSFTKALFINCDHCLLTYSFYKQPHDILKLFTIRLREIIKINLVPALIIGGGLTFLLFFTGGTSNPINYAIMFVSIICMSIFFSVHYLVLYYLLQPFNANTEIKSGTYQLISGATYFVAYLMMQARFPLFIFGVSCIVFCVLYSLIACLLIYKLAPKTFRIRN